MPTPSNVERARRARLLGSVTFIVGLWPFVPAAGQTIAPSTCPSGVQATNCYQGTYPYTDEVISDQQYGGSVGEGGEAGEGGEDGDKGPEINDYSTATIYIENNASLNQLITITSDGGTGSNEVGESGNSGNGGDGGDITLDNEGTLYWRAGEASDQVIVTSIVSGGASALTPDEHGDGGEGGNGGTITLTNNGEISVSGTFDYGVIGLDANASGGNGADRNEGAENQEGGNGGDGGVVTVTNNNGIFMDYINGSERARGISATSNGGNGGFGGFSNNEDQAKRGNGGNGYEVSVTNTGEIEIYWGPNLDGTSDELIGIKADSLGGNGANSDHDEESGGNGGSAGNVTVQNDADITVFYLNPSPSQPVSGGGIVARSLGGNGGVGNQQGDNDTDGAGGNGGGGGEDGGSGGSGTISVTHSGDGAIVTSGNELAGILAEGRGGAGGSGGSGFSENNSSGGHGGRGNAITIDLEDQASVSTDGSEAPGIMAQSVGGTGGDGGNDGGLVGEAGGAGYGGNSSAVTITTDTDTSVTTQGDFSVGIGGQSIGGGGGTGGDFYGVLGGSGGDGGRGGDSDAVTINADGTVTTGGEHSYGLMGQSIAGGGGAGGISSGTVSLGGDGAAGGTANTVTISNSGTVKTTGYASHGILAQSIAGGGGAGGVSGGVLSIGGNAAANNTANGNSVTVTQTGIISTTGVAAAGVRAQSIGGGGGSGAGAVGIASVGGQGGSGGDGGTVDLHLDAGSIGTSGNFAAAVVAQSAGGGGGSGGDAFDASLGVNLGVGGSGEVGGDGEAVTVDVGNSVSLSTQGDNAPGILAHSIGGGGGDGGNATSVGISVVNLSIGGSGDGGGDGGTVTVSANPQSTLTTQGSHSIGVLAQSIGGGGGNGGNAFGFDVSLNIAASVAVGGRAGGGGAGEAVTVNWQDSTITTGSNLLAAALATEDGQPIAITDQASNAYGIVAQSIGGGGGNGGSATVDQIVISIPDPDPETPIPTINVTSAVGGAGGAGGDAGEVGVTVGAGEVATYGAGSHSILAQSVGGGGGTGGDGTALGVSAAIPFTETTSPTIDLSFALGGSGGAAGDAEAVSVGLGKTATSTTTVATFGDNANAVVAQSIGGGGGDAGAGSSSTYNLGEAKSVTVGLGLGGKGSGGGAGGTVDVTLGQLAQIQTVGSGSRGIVAQSISGGGGTSQGGTGALSAGPFIATVQVGRPGGGGGDGNTVTVDNEGTIQTFGGDGDGIFAQSIGGGGGLGGSFGADGSLDDPNWIDFVKDVQHVIKDIDDDGASYTTTVTVGGQGGTGGAGGEVDITNTGTVSTVGDWADGIVAQSIGGGGGAGGTAVADGSQQTVSVNVGVGGKGGGGGTGGAVNINGVGTISTQGYGAYGLLAQSIGGGGGQGGDGSNKATGRITVGSGAGGGGGNAGDGGAVQLGVGQEASGTVTTTGVDAHAVVVQSIGGGGGVGGAGNSQSAAVFPNNAFDIVVGGGGGSSGIGGSVTVGDPTYGTNLDITTTGARAVGLVAQSIGGGGGIGGVAGGSADVISSVVLGGQGGGALNGGTVTINGLDGDITTHGSGAHAVVAQSIGGGGGIGGHAGTGVLSLDGNSPGGYGNGEDVTIWTDGGNITTTGDAAFGILAQSIGGGGGFGGDQTGGFAGSNGNLDAEAAQSGDVYISKLDGSISATGENSIAIFAQSDSGGQNNGTITTLVSDAIITGGSGEQGAGVWVDEGSSANYLQLSGGSISALSGNAVVYTGSGTLNVKQTNGGTIQGNVDLRNDTEELARLENTSSLLRAGELGLLENVSGVLLAGELLDANVINSGLLQVGGVGGVPLNPTVASKGAPKIASAAGVLETTRVGGNLTQEASGVLALDADFAGARMDRLTIAGDATLDGKFEVNAISVLPGISLPFLTAGGTLDHSLSARSSIFDYAVTQAGNGLSLSATSAHFAQPGFALNHDQGNVAGHLQAIWDAGGGSFGTLFGTLGSLADSNGDTYGSALSDMSPGVSGAAAAGSIAMTQQHLDLLLSCPMFAAGTSFLTETECGWAQAGGQVLDQKASGGVSGFDTTTYSMQAGAQFEVSPDWFVGVAGGYDRSAIRGDDSRVNADGDILYAGVSLKRQTGPWLLSGAVAGSYGWYDNTRTIRIPGFAGQAEGDPNVYNLSARMRAAYTFAQDPYYVRPLVDLDLIYTHADGYRETGTGALDLLVEGAGQWSFHATPAVEVGTRVDVSETTVMRAFAAAGVSFGTADSWDTSARLAAAPAGVGLFDSEVPLANVVGRLTAGVDLANDSGFGVRLNYQGSFSDTYTSHGGSLRLSYKF